jgi:Skp family chaperone for outer membrane proteins
MKLVRLLAAFTFVTTLGVSFAVAQQKPAPAATAESQGAGSLPDSKMAIVYSDAFLDEKAGIGKYKTVVNALNKEFEPRLNELKQLETKLKQLQDEIEALQKNPTASQAQIQAKMDQYTQLKTDGQRKSEDSQSAYDKRKAVLLQPLQDDILKALEAYAKAHNIAVIIDGSQVPLVFAADALDITAGFIKEYNSKNPATAAATPR